MPPLNKFIGVYSGRVPTDHPHETQIGLVWGDYLIDEVIAGSIREEYAYPSLSASDACAMALAPRLRE
jgi:hypothetical protein